MQKSPIEVTTHERAIEAIPAPELFQPRTSIQVHALDYYNRGLNVFPTPRPAAVRAWAAANGGDPTSKPSYAHKHLFYTRLHVCSPECKRHELTTGRLPVKELKGK